MNFGTYIQNEREVTSGGEERLHTFENVPEREQSSFFDDLDERNVMNDVIASGHHEVD